MAKCFWYVSMEAFDADEGDADQGVDDDALVQHMVQNVNDAR